MRYPVSSALLVACVACSGRDVPKTAAAETRPVAADSQIAPRNQSWCRDTTPSHPDPGKLIRDYVRRDAGGEFLATNKFWSSATECAEGGSSVPQVIASYGIDSVGIRADTARFAVQYHFLGDLLQGPSGFAPHVRTETDTFVVIHRPYGWRIVGHHEMPILMRKAAQKYWPLTRADLATLDSAARSTPD